VGLAIGNVHPGGAKGIVSHSGVLRILLESFYQLNPFVSTLRGWENSIAFVQDIYYNVYGYA